MNRPEVEPLEAELRRLKPAPVPEDLLARLVELQPKPARHEVGWVAPSSWQLVWRRWRWWTPGLAAASVFAALWAVRLAGPAAEGRGRSVEPGTRESLRADDVLIDRRLVSTFDAVAEMPDGEPVRFRCREWADGVVLRDTARGVEIERRTPRFEVVPVRFETY